MKTITGACRIMFGGIAWSVFVVGIVLAGLGICDFVPVFVHLAEGGGHSTSLMAIGLLHIVDVFLVAIEFFVVSSGFFVFFHNGHTPMQVSFPERLRVRNFAQQKIILWEAIFTPPVVRPGLTESTNPEGVDKLTSDISNTVYNRMVRSGCCSIRQLQYFL